MGFLGGGEQNLLTLMEGLREVKGHKIYLFAQPGELVLKARELGFTVYEYNFDGFRRTWNPLGWLTGSAKFWVGVLDVKRIIIDNNIKIVHSNSLKSAIMGGLSARQAGVPMVFHNRDFFLQAGIFRNQFIRWVYKLSDQIIVCSNSVAGLYGSDIQEKVITVYDGIVIPSSGVINKRDAVRSVNCIKPDDIVIGYVGRLHPDKGIETLLSGFKVIQDSLPQIQLWVVGGPMPNEDAYAEKLKRKVAQLRIEHKTRFFGWRHDALDLMAGLDLLAVPSKKEPLGRVYVEAMLMGIPVIATASGGTAEAIDDQATGLLFPPNDHKALAQSALRILNNDGFRNKLTASAKQEATKRFGKDQYINGVQSVYDSLVGK